MVADVRIALRRGTKVGLFTAIVLFAFCLRLIYLNEARHVVFFNNLVVDAREYDRWSDEIRAGDWLGGAEVFYQAPLYPYFLAVVKTIVGDDLWRVRLVQCAIGALSCGLLFLAARRFFCSRIAFVAGLMLALYPPAIFFDTLIQKSVLDLLFSTLLLWLLAGAWLMRLSGWRWFALGVVVGMLSLTRENAILLALVFAAAPLVRFRSFPLSARGAAGAAVLAGAAIVLLPVGVRNRAVGGEFTLTTSQAGPNFYIGNNPQATGIYAPLRTGRSDTPLERIDARELAEEAAGQPLSPREVSAYWRGRAIHYITSHPFAWLYLMQRKLMLVINAYEVPDAEDMYFYAHSSRILSIAGRFWHFGVLAPLAVLGAVLTYRRFRSELWILHALIATLAASVILFYVFARYRFPIVPPMMMLAASGVVGVARWNRYSRRQLFVGACAVVLTAVVANWRIFRTGEHAALSYANAAAIYEDANDTPAAIHSYREALRHDPGMSELRLNLGLVLANSGDLDAAMEEFRELIRRHPNHTAAHMYLGSAYAQRGQFNQAIEHLSRATELDPSSPMPRTNLATLQLNLGRWQDGLETLRSGVRASPDDPVLGSMLIAVLATAPNPDVRDVAEAIRLGEQLNLKTNNSNIQLLEALGTAYEAAGRFDDARERLESAIRLAREQNDDALADELTARINRYPKK